MVTLYRMTPQEQPPVMVVASLGRGMVVINECSPNERRRKATQRETKVLFRVRAYPTGIYSCACSIKNAAHLDSA